MTDQYIITGEQLDELEYELSKRLFCMQWQKMQIPEIRSHPLSSALKAERVRVLAIVDKYCFDTKPEDYDTEYAYPDRFDAGQRYAYEAVRNKLESLRDGE